MQQDDNGVKLARLNRESPPAQRRLEGCCGKISCHRLGSPDEGAGEGQWLTVASLTSLLVCVSVFVCL